MSLVCFPLLPSFSTFMVVSSFSHPCVWYVPCYFSFIPLCIPPVSCNNIPDIFSYITTVLLVLQSLSTLLSQLSFLHFYYFLLHSSISLCIPASIHFHSLFRPFQHFTFSFPAFPHVLIYF